MRAATVGRLRCACAIACTGPTKRPVDLRQCSAAEAQAQTAERESDAAARTAADRSAVAVLRVTIINHLALAVPPQHIPLSTASAVRTTAYSDNTSLATPPGTATLPLALYHSSLTSVRSLSAMSR